ncbi:MAG: endonuclease MutS2 [Clostridia bacterium]|nr:endonuclease MutS2 [Clostridia bacterium]
MISEKTLKAVEYDKILKDVASFATLEKTKDFILSFSPVCELNAVDFLLKKTAESFKLLYDYGQPEIYFCYELTDELNRVDAGGTLTAAEILSVTSALKSARIARTSILSVHDDKIKFVSEIASRLFINPEFEKEVAQKIISEDEISDNASPKLFSIRKSIRNLNAKIRDTLNVYMRGGFGKYLQDSVITLRGDRYVIPVKSEYRSFVKGFIHDQSSTGATVFIEPEAVLELNNELKRATFDEAEEIHKILFDLSSKITNMSQAIRYNYENLSEIDYGFACAIYSFKNKCTMPLLNDKGIIDIKRGRHPLISIDKVVPVSVNLGDNYRFLLISGPNTGGKTVTLKLVGLLTLMAMTGLYIPADDESKISVFNSIFCDVGDEQSIENDLSTFSSHIVNVKYIIENADGKSLVLIDEIGAGTDPEEGSALAIALVKKLLNLSCYGVITTHYNGLKEFAENSGVIENASMQFDPDTLKPLYRLNVGIPGSSNAIDIAKTLGIPTDVIKDAEKNLSAEKTAFEKVLKRAEQSRRESEELKKELEQIKSKQAEELAVISVEKEKIIKEREKISLNARAETKRIVSDKLEEAEEIIAELKDILKRADLESRELVKASELKNRLKNSRYLDYDPEGDPIKLEKTIIDDLKPNDKVYVKSLKTYGKVLSVKKNKGEIEVLIGNIKTIIKSDDLFNREAEDKKNNVKDKVTVKRSVLNNLLKSEINVVGKNLLDALDEVESFIDKAVVGGITEIKIIHGVGQGILLKGIRDYLKSNKNVAEFRRGKYGEGENGVTIVTLK